jgi:polysaccharide export outer membrane protein
MVMKTRNPANSTWLLPILIGILLFSGCGGGNYTPVRTDYVEFTDEQKAQINSDSHLPYRIQTEDVLRVAVSGQKDLKADGVLVLPDGAVSLVGAGRVEVAGLSLDEADSLITAAYARDIRDPEVSVIVAETGGTRIYVLGEVRSPGMQKMPRGGLGIIGAVTLAGGFTEDAAPEGAVLVRVTGEGYLVKEIDLSNFGQVDAMDLALVGLQPYDVVYVPRSRIGDFGYFSRNVLSGLVSITRMAVDIKYLTNGWNQGVVR